MSSNAPPADQMAEIKQVPIVGQAMRWNDGPQHTSLLYPRHETFVGQLVV